MKYTISYLLSGVLLLSLVSCGPEEEVKAPDFEETKDSIDFEKQVSIDLISVNFPSPSTLSKKFNAAGLSYNKSVLSSSGRSFSTKGEQALGMGTLGADLGFTCSFNQQQDALEYLGAIGRIAEQLGVSTAFDQEFNKKLIASLGKADTQDVMIDLAYKKAERHMRSNERMALSGLMVLGGWVEGLYVSTEMLYSKKDDPKAKGLYLEVWNYASAHQHVRDLLNEYKDDADYKAFNESFTAAENVLNNVAHNNNFGPKDIEMLRTTVQTLRSKVVK